MTSVPFTAVAHRGDPYAHRENTLPAIRSAVRAGADAVEVDVRLTADGTPVLLHDADLKRLWGHDRALSGLHLIELLTLTGNGVPTLHDALAETTAVRTLIDLPDPAAAEAAVAAVQASGAADRVYYCGGPAAMRAVRRAAPGAELALTLTSLAPPRPPFLSDLRPRWLNYRFGLLSPELVAKGHAGGHLVAAWTVDTRRNMTRLRRMGVDAITTNRIGVLCGLSRRGARP